MLLYEYRLDWRIIMQAISNSPVFMGKNLKITHKINSNKKFLYNDVMSVLKENRVPATISNKGVLINMPEVVSMQEKVMGDLTKAGVNFDVIG